MRSVDERAAFIFERILILFGICGIIWANIVKELELCRMSYLDKYTSPVLNPSRPVLGRDAEIKKVLSSFCRPEISNVILLAPAGTGKTTIVQGARALDKDRIYLEVDLTKMMRDVETDVNQMASMLKSLVDEASEHNRTSNKQVVLFLDEFHQVVHMSPAAVEALKPILAMSGVRGVKIIAATTYEEFREYISPNQALVERLQRIDVSETDYATTVAILKGMADRYKDDIKPAIRPHIFNLIVEYSDRYIPASAQPRKAINILDGLIGMHRFTKQPIDENMLNEFIRSSVGVNVAFTADPNTVRQRLGERVFDQNFALDVIADKLHICLAGLNDKNRPMLVSLFTGSTGTGKMLPDDCPIPVPSGGFVRNGDLCIGDRVFGANGAPVKVTGVYPQGVKRVYRMTLSDERTIESGDGHLWNCGVRSGGRINFGTYSTEQIYDLFRRGKRIVLPLSGAAEFEPNGEPLMSPYALGVYLSDAVSSETFFVLDCSCPSVAWEFAYQLSSSIDDGDTVKVVCEPLTAARRYIYRVEWGLDRFREVGGHVDDDGYIMALPFLPQRISDEYMYASVEDRWGLVRGLFDANGMMCADRLQYMARSEELAQEVSKLLYSLGVSNYIRRKMYNGVEYSVVRVRTCNEKFMWFFLMNEKRVDTAANRFRKAVKRPNYYDEWVGIKDIELTDEYKPMTCIEVDSADHLYLAGDYIVTHNTETAKTLAKILFGSENELVRVDCTEFGQPDSVDRFRNSVTDKVWAKPYCVLLFDEVEKACREVISMLLQLLDDSRLTDRNGREVSFKNCYIILTTNAGATIYETLSQYTSGRTSSGGISEKYDKLIRTALTTAVNGTAFPVELLGRINAIVPYAPLLESTQISILKAKLNELMHKVYETHGVVMRYHQHVVDFIIKDKMTTEAQAGGARRVVQMMDQYVTTAVARFINTHKGVRNILVRVNGEMAHTDKYKLVSEAYIDVVEYKS